MDKIKKFIECIIPNTVCNLKCDYCYIIQENRRTMKMPHFLYEPTIIGKALSQKRLGGIAYISICGMGETLLSKEVPLIVYEILKQGHYVNITSNGTINKRFDEIFELIPKQLLEKLHFALSFHYLELKKTNNLDNFVRNVNKIKENGSSYVIQMNLYDGYIEHIEEIKKFCIENFNSLPQLAATRKELVKDNTNHIEDVSLHTDNSINEYIEIGKKFNSPLFDYTIENFKVKRKEFCYAGEWSFLLNLSNGMIRKCYFSKEHQNIFENIKKPIKLEAVGNNCECTYCNNSSHFMSLGVIPEKYKISYAELRNRDEANWYNEKMKSFLNTKLFESNKVYSKLRKVYVNFKYLLIKKIKKIIKTIIKIFRGKIDEK